MIDNSGKPAAVEQIVTKVRPKAPNFVRDIKKVSILSMPDVDAPVMLHTYNEEIGDSIVTYHACPVEFCDYGNGQMYALYNTLECACVTWT